MKTPLLRLVAASVLLGAPGLLPHSDEALAQLVRSRMDEWAPEFQTGQGPAV